MISLTGLTLKGGTVFFWGTYVGVGFFTSCLSLGIVIEPKVWWDPHSPTARCCLTPAGHHSPHLNGSQESTNSPGLNGYPVESFRS
jgi:hypothetical protein